MIYIRKALYNYRPKLRQYANVIGTGRGYKYKNGEKTRELCISVFVKEKVAIDDLDPKDIVPKMLGGIPTDIHQTGIMRANGLPTDRQRPAMGGSSIGHIGITAGTLGFLAKKDGETVIVSNNHVLANVNEAEIGDAIVQPGAYDGGKMPDDHIANLLDFVYIRQAGEFDLSECPIGNGAAGFANFFARMVGSGTRLQAIRPQEGFPPFNLVDLAIAKPLSDDLVTPEIMNIGVLTGQQNGELGMKVKKSGRTTGYQEGEIEQIDVEMLVDYGGKLISFTDQLMVGPNSTSGFSAPGDSGSAVVDEGNKLVGLLFAGSETTTLINRSERVLAALGLTL